MWDLESFPWPFDDNSADEIVMRHSLEHMGASADVFFSIMKELYRISAPGAKILIAVPHPRSDGFAGDPTHVRPINPAILSLFSKKNNREWKDLGSLLRNRRERGDCWMTEAVERAKRPVAPIGQSGSATTPRWLTAQVTQRASQPPQAALLALPAACFLVFSVRRADSECSFLMLCTAACKFHSPRQRSSPRMLKWRAS